jgi:hypothetical protein
VCETALVYRTITQVAGHTGALRETPTEAPGPMQFSSPYGFGGGIILAMAMKKRRRLAELGGSMEDYGHIALNAREWAALNAERCSATRSRWTTTGSHGRRSLLLFDCDYPVSVVCRSSPPPSGHLAQPLVLVDALAYGTSEP